MSHVSANMTYALYGARRIPDNLRSNSVAVAGLLPSNCALETLTLTNHCGLP